MADDIRIVRLDRDTAHLMHRVAEEVFDGPIRTETLDAFLDDPAHHMFIAVTESTVVGMASCVVYLHPDKDPNMWINEVGVGRAVRRQGIGKMLVDALLDLSKKLGCKEAWLGTELDNTAARALYEASSKTHPAVDDPKGTEIIMFAWNTDPEP